MWKYLCLQALYGWSIIHIHALNLSSLGHSHAASLFTHENQKNVGSQYHMYRSYICCLSSCNTCISFSCFHKQSKTKKCFFNFPRPNHNTKRLKDNPKNVSLPMKVDKYLWKLVNLLCEDHFVPDNFNQINGTFASDHHHPDLDQSNYCVCCRFSCLPQWQCQTNTIYIMYALCPIHHLQWFQLPFFSHSYMYACVRLAL